MVDFLRATFDRRPRDVLTVPQRERLGCSDATFLYKQQGSLACYALGSLSAAKWSGLARVFAGAYVENYGPSASAEGLPPYGADLFPTAAGGGPA